MPVFLDLLVEQAADVLVDYSWSQTTYSLGIWGFLLLQIAVTLIEAVVFKLFKWGSWRTAFIDATIVNLITSLVGVIIGLFDINHNPIEFLYVAFVASVLIEGFWLHKKQNSMSLSRRWMMILTANIFSYALLITIIQLDKKSFNDGQIRNYRPHTDPGIETPEPDSTPLENP